MKIAVSSARTYHDELNEICRKNRGILRPEDVVEYASNPETKLHSAFTWNEGQAANLWRLHQARNIIRVSITIEATTNITTRTFVSLSSDRENGGGYRMITSVLNSTEMRNQLLADAKKELQAFEAKYGGLKELQRVFEEIKKL